MNLCTIQNDFLSVHLAESGAEIRHLFTQKDKKEWMWEGNPFYWSRVAPVLFPVVGKLADNQYFHNGVPYPLSQHGFARDRIFEVVESHPEHIRFHLHSDYDSRKFYPFNFDLFIGYNLAKNWLWIDYEVINSGEETMYFSIGGHPGFALPDWPRKKYYLEFEEPDLLEPRLLQAGLLEKTKGPILELDNMKLEIESDLFSKDALVFENLRSSWVGIQSEKGDHGLRLHFEGFPFFGIWAKENAPFVCLEPWYGHADLVGFEGEISQKAGILKLLPEENFHCRYAIEILNY
jgi:galactose mutarotase-like enzyme